MTAIEWTDATWNPTTGCSKVSAGCDNCYAETLSLRFGWSKKPWTPENAAENVVLHPERLRKPLSWREPRRVFVNSMSDLFHELVPEAYIRQVFDVMAEAKRHTFQVLTKRPARMALWTQRYQPDPLPNVWLGTSIESWRFNHRVYPLKQTPAAVRFISAEPLLGSLYSRKETDGHRTAPSFGSALPARDGAARPSDARGPEHLAVREATALRPGDAGGGVRAAGGLRHGLGSAPLDLTGIDWVIVGGESGPGARPMQPEWVREIRDACTAKPLDDETAFFFKQWGGRTPKAGGRMLDGHEWSEYP